MAASESSHFESVLIALADPTRRELLDLIALRGQATATTLAAAVTVSRQAVVKHLTILKEAGLVSSNRVGREVRYKVCTRQLSSTAEWMANLAADWDRKLDWIKRTAEDS
ncbi:helix-turn-helix transcriptional regulator [Halobacillus sp. A5]|uniref:ArsR/SmtB family transcription factor n=1 Tax=Halobacillus sp. A5 TaxID=2880263 RepID=UPI0020A63B9B|nr:metalloregulator ArsR/SmtB family transcription factor [Halobacillus sp. A5]MCP3027726.1 metalloregulator ArsR/SmtB family transcription factor [Halobacillus sp. A5]